VKGFITLHHSDNKKTSRRCAAENHLVTDAAAVTTAESTQHCSAHERDGDTSSTKSAGGDCSQTNVIDMGLSAPKFSYYPNGATRPIDSTASTSSRNHELQNAMSELIRTSSGPMLTAEQTPERSVATHLHACNDKDISISSDTETDDLDATHQNTNHQDTCDETSITIEEHKQNSPPSDSKDDATELAATANDSDIAMSETASTAAASASANGCADMPASMHNGTCQENKVRQTDKQGDDSVQPFDFSVSGLGTKTESLTVRTNRTPAEASASDDSQARKSDGTSGAAPKTHHSKHSVKSDSYRPAGRLMHDLGLELVRELVYRDLIDIQMVKDAENRLEDREKGQLLKLIEAQERLAARNEPYRTLPAERCSRCGFTSPSTNVMTLHCEYGTISRIDPTIHICCLCNGTTGYRTRNTAQFVTHVSTVHGLTGRLMKKTLPYACNNCMFDHKSIVRLTLHLDKCVKKFSLATNLQPLPGDCDIPLMYRPSDRKQLGSYTQSSNMPFSASASGPPSVRTLLSSQRHEVSAGYIVGSSSQAAVTSSLICEICGKLVEGREALWAHFRLIHHVELCRTTMRDKEPWMKCDVCGGRFWTYQGLSRHLLLAHNRALAGGPSFTTGPPPPVTPPAVAARCHICGGSQTSNPLSHFSAYHNVTLLEMYHAKLCCICNRKVNSGRAFEQHMVEQHSDIFANYDVLRTVLQALTTARYFKADDTREPTTHHIKQLSAHDVTGRKKSLVDSAPQTTAVGGCSNYTAANVTDGSMQTVHQRKHASGIISSTPKKKFNTNASGLMKHKFAGTSGSLRGRKKHVSMPETSETSAVTKATERAAEATAEEVKKLYEDLAHIGRPILRSMRHRLSTNSSSEVIKTATNCEDNSMSKKESEQQNDSISTADDDEIPTKKIHLDDLDVTMNKVCTDDDVTNNSV